MCQSLQIFDLVIGLVVSLLFKERCSVEMGLLTQGPQKTKLQARVFFYSRFN